LNHKFTKNNGHHAIDRVNESKQTRQTLTVELKRLAKVIVVHHAIIVE
jgi:hypothetical protein